jgi:hypothetical protein
MGCLLPSTRKLSGSPSISGGLRWWSGRLRP